MIKEVKRLKIASLRVSSNIVQNVCEIYKDNNVGRGLNLCFPSFDKVIKCYPKVAEHAHHRLQPLPV